MNELNEKYLARMLEGAEQGLEQVDTAVEQINAQLEGMMEQRQEMVTAVAELKDLLGLEEEPEKEETEESGE
jgi:chorismate mutase